jgi:hypothetical protein
MDITIVVAVVAVMAVPILTLADVPILTPVDANNLAATMIQLVKMMTN